MLLGSYDRIWRPIAARPGRSAYESFSGATLVESYAANGHRALGIGGVQFFDPDTPSNSLPALFPEFLYYGPSAGVQDLVADRTADVLPAAMLSRVISKLRRHQPFFLFANLSETHFPYTTPAAAPLYSELEPHLISLGAATKSKMRLGAKDDELRRWLPHIHRMQVRALEWVDEQLHSVFALLESAKLPTLIVVCADHGENFGERGLTGHGNSSRAVMTVPLWAGRIEPS